MTTRRGEKRRFSSTQKKRLRLRFRPNRTVISRFLGQRRASPNARRAMPHNDPRLSVLAPHGHGLAFAAMVDADEAFAAIARAEQAFAGREVHQFRVVRVNHQAVNLVPERIRVAGIGVEFGPGCPVIGGFQ